MSVLLPNDLSWAVANWASFGFFHDCAPHLPGAPLLAREIQFCIDAEVDTLDMRKAGRPELKELETLLASVLDDTHARGAASFADPAAYPIYLVKLQELVDVLQRAAAATS